MTVLLELDERLAEQLREYCHRRELRENDLVNRLLRDFLTREEPRAPTPFECWQQVFTPEGSGVPDLGSRAKHHLREKLRGKHSD